MCDRQFSSHTWRNKHVVEQHLPGSLLATASKEELEAVVATLDSDGESDIDANDDSYCAAVRFAPGSSRTGGWPPPCRRNLLCCMRAVPVSLPALCCPVLHSPEISSCNSLTGALIPMDPPHPHPADIMDTTRCFACCPTLIEAQWRSPGDLLRHLQDHRCCPEQVCCVLSGSVLAPCSPFLWSPSSFSQMPSTSR